MRTSVCIAVVFGAMMAGGAVGQGRGSTSKAWMDQLAGVAVDERADVGRPPFSLTYDGLPVEQLLDPRDAHRETEQLDENRTRLRTTWIFTPGRLKLVWDCIRYSDFPAMEWLLTLENVGAEDTVIIDNVQVLDVGFDTPISGRSTYRLHRTNGAPSNPTDFAVSTVEFNSGDEQVLGGGGGRSSNKDFPFFEIETDEGSVIVAVGWSGQWQARVFAPEQHALRVTAGLEKTHFRLHPGEKVRMPRILVLNRDGDTLESNAQFRQLIYKHDVALKNGRKPLPTLYCNTCFTRGGGWLNECNAENQISLINAYAPLGLEALLTDAGWFEGGWPAGAGNWTPRKNAYPDGMRPVAAAAKRRNMLYGLWFEPERVVANTAAHRDYPDWCLKSQAELQGTYLLNFGLPEVQDYFFNIVKGFMDLPGFRVYRQDFNMDPLPYWRFNDAPDRVGITEIKYITGLYAYWDRIASTWPDGLRIECSSGGRRIDLETVMRMHVHQKSDYWFDNEVDQASIWGLSEYLPNNVFMAPINRMDDYSFHSAMAASLCMGWITDAPDFDVDRGRKLLDRYREVRHLLIGASYPLLPYSRDKADWIASQYHCPDLDKGMILAFRRENNTQPTVSVALKAIDPNADYELKSDRTGRTTRHSGIDLMTKLELQLDRPHSSDLLSYQRVR